MKIKRITAFVLASIILTAVLTMTSCRGLRNIFNPEFPAELTGSWARGASTLEITENTLSFVAPGSRASLSLVSSARYYTLSWVDGAGVRRNEIARIVYEGGSLEIMLDRSPYSHWPGMWRNALNGTWTRQ